MYSMRKGLGAVQSKGAKPDPAATGNYFMSTLFKVNSAKQSLVK